MRIPKKSILLVFALAFVLFGFQLPKNIQKKVDKEIQKFFEVTDFAMESITVQDNLNEKLPAKITGENFYKIVQENSFIGYLFIDKAPSKTASFDYLVVFDADLKIIHSKVIIYREEYGGEIGSKRWLKQFLGKTGGDRVDYESNIDGIAGATISVRSMTNSVDKLLQTIQVLKENKVL